MRKKLSLNSFLVVIIFSRVLLALIFAWSFFTEHILLMMVSLFLIAALVFRIFIFDKGSKKSFFETLVRLFSDKFALIVVSGCIASKVPVLLPVFLIVIVRELFVIMGNVSIVRQKGENSKGRLNDNLLCFLFFLTASFMLFSNKFYPMSGFLHIISWVLISLTVLFAVVSFVMLYKVFQKEINEN